MTHSFKRFSFPRPDEPKGEASVAAANGVNKSKEQCSVDDFSMSAQAFLSVGISNWVFLLGLFVSNDSLASDAAWLDEAGCMVR